MRARQELGSFRAPRVFGGIRAAIAAASRSSFRIIHFSVQSDHLHLVVEARDATSLARGALGLATRVARAVNRVLRRRGSVWGDRYHARSVSTPVETRNLIRYVIMNFRKHRPGDHRRLDPCSSAPWFDGFREPIPPALDPPATRPPSTWLLRTGWRRRGLIHLDESAKPIG
jgi:hypothetical protein